MKPSKGLARPRWRNVILDRACSSCRSCDDRWKEYQKMIALDETLISTIVSRECFFETTGFRSTMLMPPILSERQQCTVPPLRPAALPHDKGSKSL